MKYSIGLMPLVLAVLAVDTFSDGASLTTIGAVLLVCYGTVAAYRTGARWESHWADLAEEAAARRS
jgi:hypothetical protein